MAWFEIVTSLFVYILRGTSPFFSSVSCHFPFGNHAKTDIFPHNILITFAADVQPSALHIAFQARRSLSCFPFTNSRCINIIVYYNLAKYAKENRLDNEILMDIEFM